MTTPPQIPSELDKVVEEVSTQLEWAQANGVLCILHAYQLEPVLLAAKRLKEVEFLLENANEAVTLKEQEFSALRTEYKKALEALNNGLLSLRHVVTALHANNAISPDARVAINQMKAVLSTPHAIAAMKKGEV